MKVADELELRGLAAELVLGWYAESAGKGLDDATPDDFKQLIRAAYVVSDEAGHSLDRWINAGRHAGLSWSDIGRELGVSRQAAQQRFARLEAPTTEEIESDDSQELICRTGLTAFNEVAAMEEEGRKGNELVGADFFKLYFSPRDTPWENMRITALRGAATIRRYEKLGWTHALSWYPFHYFTRPSTGVD